MFCVINWNHWLGVKHTEHIILTINKLPLEKSICCRTNSLKDNIANSVIAIQILTVYGAMKEKIYHEISGLLNAVKIYNQAAGCKAFPALSKIWLQLKIFLFLPYEKFLMMIVRMTRTIAPVDSAFVFYKGHSSTIHGSPKITKAN